MKKEKIIETLLLIRVDDKKQDCHYPVNELTSYANNLELNIDHRHKIESHGLDLATAEDFIAYMKKRPRYKRIVCYDITRIFRNKEGFRLVKAFLVQHGIKVYAMDMPYTAEDGSVDFYNYKIEPDLKDQNGFIEDSKALF